MSFVVTVLEGIGLLLGFGAFLFIIVIITKFVGGKANKVMKGRHINIVETLNLGLDKQLHLVRVGQQFILIASSGKNVQFLSDIKLEDYDESEVQENNTLFDFKNLFEKYLQNFNKDKTDNLEKKLNSEGMKGAAEGEKIRDNLNRLKMINTGALNLGKEDEDG